MAEQLTSCTTGAIKKTDCVSVVTHKLWHIYCRAASFQHCVHPVTPTAPMTLPLTQPGTGLAPSDWWQCSYITAFVYLFVCLLMLHFLSPFCTISSLVRETRIYIYIYASPQYIYIQCTLVKPTPLVPSKIGSDYKKVGLAKSCNSTMH